MIKNKIDSTSCTVFQNELTGNLHIQVYAKRSEIIRLGIMIGFQPIVYSEIKTDPRRPDMAAGMFILPH